MLTFLFALRIGNVISLAKREIRELMNTLLDKHHLLQK